MTYGQLFMILNPNVKVVENGTCVWIYFDSANHDTLRVEWWNKEIPNEQMKAQEPVKPIMRCEMDDICSCIDNVAYCGKCGEPIGRLKQNYCSNCGQAVKWE